MRESCRLKFCDGMMGRLLRMMAANIEIENNNSKPTRELLMGEVSVSVSVMGIFSAISGVFTGILLIKADDSDIWVGFLCMVIAVFGFFLSTIMYANASGNLSRGNIKNAERRILIANILSEIFGVYPFLAAVPLVVWIFSNSQTLSIFVLLLSILTILFYAFSNSDIISRYFTLRNKILYIIVASICIALLNIYHFFNLHMKYIPLAIFLGFLFFSAGIMCKKTKERL